MGSCIDHRNKLFEPETYHLLTFHRLLSLFVQSPFMLHLHPFLFLFIHVYSNNLAQI